MARSRVYKCKCDRCEGVFAEVFVFDAIKTRDKGELKSRPFMVCADCWDFLDYQQSMANKEMERQESTWVK